MMKIVQAPNPVLSGQAKAVGNIDRGILRLIKEMEETLVGARDPEGVGLAAPQVGKSLQIFIIKQTPRSQTQVFINPIIEEFVGENNIAWGRTSEEGEGEKESGSGVQLEGCLSLYSIWGEVKRYPGVVVSYMDESGKRRRRTFSGFIAVIIQHEFDHLQGILFPKRVLEQKGKLYKSSKNNMGESVFEEIEI
jgi:peptide deformylase